MSASDRVKHSINIAYKTIGDPLPKNCFADKNWMKAKNGIDKRNALMHPKKKGCLTINEDEWLDIYDGLVWLVQLVNEFLNLWEKRYKNV